MKLLLTIFRSVIAYGLFTILCALFFFPVLLLCLIPARWCASSTFSSGIVASVAHYFYKGALFCSLLRIRYEGVKNIPEGPVIFVANHQSALDIPLLGVLAGRMTHLWLATTWLLHSPIFRLVLPRACALIDTQTQFKAMRSLLYAIKLVNNGHKGHVLMFPEGGRFTDGTVHEFYAGFVVLAKETKRPIVPVYIDGVSQAYPPSAFLVQNYPITVTIGKPLYFNEEEMSDKELKNMVYSWFVSMANQSSQAV